MKIVVEALGMESDAVVEPVTHVASALNPADLGTRGNVKIEELGAGSRWQTGPEFLTSPREQWPLRDLAVINQDKAAGQCRLLLRVAMHSSGSQGAPCSARFLSKARRMSSGLPS